MYALLWLVQAWPLTPGIWTTTHRCSRGLKGTPPVWNVLTWPSPIGGVVRSEQIGGTALCVVCFWYLYAARLSLSFPVSTVVTGSSGGGW